MDKLLRVSEDHLPSVLAALPLPDARKKAILPQLGQWRRDPLNAIAYMSSVAEDNLAASARPARAVRRATLVIASLSVFWSCHVADFSPTIAASRPIRSTWQACGAPCQRRYMSASLKRHPLPPLSPPSPSTMPPQIYKGYIYSSAHLHDVQEASIIEDGNVLVDVGYGGFEIAPGDEDDIRACNMHPWGSEWLVFSDGSSSATALGVAQLPSLAGDTRWRFSHSIRIENGLT